jgi:branched-chain amino acid transport system substrate-binding protein
VVRALEATREPTRQALMDAARSLDQAPSSMLRDGISFTTDGSRDGYPLESGQIARWDGRAYRPVGGLIDLEGRTPQAGD